MDSKTALQYAIERLNTDLSQTPHIFPITSGEQALLLEVVSTLGDLQDAIQAMGERELEYRKGITSGEQALLLEVLSTLGDL